MYYLSPQHARDFDPLQHRLVQATCAVSYCFLSRRSNGASNSSCCIGSPLTKVPRQFEGDHTKHAVQYATIKMMRLCYMSCTRYKPLVYAMAAVCILQQHVSCRSFRPPSEDILPRKTPPDRPPDPYKAKGHVQRIVTRCTYMSCDGLDRRQGRRYGQRKALISIDLHAPLSRAKVSEEGKAALLHYTTT